MFQGDLKRVLCFDCIPSRIEINEKKDESFFDVPRKLKVDDGRAPFFSCFFPPPCSSRRQHNLGTRKGLIGNPVEVGSGPAAVIGDESRKFATVTFERDGKARQLG